MLSLFDKTASLSRLSSDPLPRSLGSASNSCSSPSRPRQGSPSGLRRHRSPGRRLTDAYVRTSSSGSCFPTFSDSPRHSLPVINSARHSQPVVGSPRCSLPVIDSTRGSLPLIDSDVQVLSVLPYCNSSFISNCGPESIERDIIDIISVARVNSTEERIRPDLVRADRTSFISSACLRKSTSTDSDSSDGEMTKKKKNLSSSSSHSGNFFMRIMSALCQMFSMLLTFTIVVALIIFSASFCVVWMSGRCEELHKIKFDLVSVRETLSKHVVGQELAINQILSVLDEFHKDQFAAPAVMWCVGWTGSGKSISMDVLRNTVSSQANIQYFMPTFIPNSEPALGTFVLDAVARMNPCLRDIVIVDGWDGEGDVVLHFLSALLAKVRERGAEDSTANQLLVVVAGVHGSKAVNREYLSLRQQGVLREKLPLDVFITAASGTKEHTQMKQLGPVSIVPYLPLESEHVRQCIDRELGRLKRLFSNELLRSADGQFLDADEEAELVSSVLERLPFTPHDQPLVSASGCKRVLSTLRIMLGEQQQANGDTEHHEF